MRVVAILLVLLTGCTSPISTLVSERDSPAVSSLITSLESRPLRVHRVSFGDGEMAIRDIGPERSDRAVVFLHGVFSDHETWRFVAGALEEERCWLVDLPGSGDSDPMPASYAPEALAAALDEVLRAMPAVEHLVVVGHSMGTQVAMRLVDERVEALVLLAPLDQRLHRQHPTYRGLAEVSGFDVWVADVTGRLERSVVRAMLGGVEDPAYATREHAAHRIRILRSPSRLRATQAMIRDAISWEPDDSADWPRNEARHSTISLGDRRATMVVGAHDELMPPSTAFRLAADLGAWVVVFEGSRHSPQRDHPREVASVIRSMISGSAPTDGAVYDLRSSASRSGSSASPNRAALPIEEW
ncbi:MAG: alpha/beta hydrolase [Phycisphaerales bacterium]|nr:alpha/beta hydrolase [Phycisphaerales bacterium]